MNVIETLITDENGQAISSDLPAIDEKYYIKETKSHELYELSNEILEIELTSNEITDIVFENESKKSSLKIIKLDVDNNEIYIPNTTFEVIDETLNKVIATVTTNEQGIAIVDNLKVTHTYSVKEVKSNYKYKLNEEIVTNITIKPNQENSITIENEKLKGQVKVIKVDKDNNEVKLEGIEFVILDSKMNVIETLKTDKNGEAVSSLLPIVDEVYFLKETATQELYVLSEEIKEITLKENEITNITFENEKKKGTITIKKVDSANDEITLKGAVFGVYNENQELVTTITTNENGEVTSERLILGKYFIKELETGSVYYLLNEEIYTCELTDNNENILLQIANEGTDIEVTVDKEGTTEIKPKDKVDYTFSNVGNASNIYLENFKWFDYIPTDYIRLETMTTGIWNQDLTYDVYYKTNMSEDYVLFKEDLSTQENYNLDFTTIEFAEGEYIIETCFDFGKVDTGFKERISPTMQCQSLDTLQDNQTFTNYTKTVGIYFGITAEANSKWTTVVHTPKEEHEPVLPRTGK